MNGVCQTHESIGKRLGEIPSSYYDLNNPPKCAWDGCDELAPRRANVIGDKSLCQRHRHRLKQYGPGFLYVDYLVLLEQQDGLCALPNCWRPMVEGDDDIDHDHDQGHVRGLMCRNHNRQFGHVEALVAENFGNDIHAFVVWVEDYVKESKAA